MLPLTHAPESFEHMRLSALTCAMLTALVAGGTAALAQPVRGVGDDALTAPKGKLWLQFGTSIGDARERYGITGARERLGAPFSLDSIGISQFPGLTPLQTALRTLTRDAGFSVSLGRSLFSSTSRVQTTPVSMEFGISKRLSLGIVVPIVATRNEAILNLNGSGARGNLSYNPLRSADSAAATTAAAANALLVSQLTASRQQLTALIASCSSSPGSNSRCPAILSTGGTLNSNAAAFADAVTQVYGTQRGRGAAFVPFVGSAADSAVLRSVSALRTQYDSLGITALAQTTLPSRATSSLTRDGLQNSLADSTLGVYAAPFGTVRKLSVGDIEVGAKYRVFDSFAASPDTARFLPVGTNLRQSLAAVVRLGTGKADESGNFFDVATGDGQTDVELRSFTDVMYGKHFFGTVVARYTLQLPDELNRRITESPSQVFPARYRDRLVSRNLGDQIQIELTPRWTLSDFFSFGAQYVFRKKLSDAYAGTFTVPVSESGLSAPLTLDAATLNLQSGATEQRFGWGLSFSTVAAHARGKAKLPLDIQYFNTRTLSGSGGIVPITIVHQIQVRMYPRS
jgi:hypothetical protein